MPNAGTPAKKGNDPFARLAANTTRSPRASAPPPTPKDLHDAFLLPRAQETTFHRRLRTLLLDFVKQLIEWEEEHTLEGIRWASEARQVWDEIARYATAPVTNSSILRTSPKDDEQQRASLIPLLQTLEHATTELSSVLARLEKHGARITVLADMGTELLLEASDGGKEAAAFGVPMWGTWTMERFVLAMRSLAQQYALSTTEIALLVPQLYLPTTIAPADAPTDTAKRAILEQFVRLPHLHPSGLASHAPSFGADAALATGASRHFFEHVCEAEVRGW